ncbi:MAG: 16S rRNA (cytosine(1402)-N(4))-methyltransferase RsmH [Clostridia bacterium]|nr:16S rRNA (cytosine(1402)-N(4))-methyltransferase RsmH [Clostridia bacterium]
MEFKHVPIMLDACIEGLNIKGNGVYFDGTLGGGGHSGEILGRLTSGKLIATDLDDEAIAAAKEKLSFYGDKFLPVHGNFKNFKEIIRGFGFNGLDGILLDLGVSSYQLDNRSRGFSYMGNGKLDMRMDGSQDFSAYDVINGYGENELRNVISAYGEERFAGKIAAAIVKKRAEGEIRTTGELAEIIEEAIPKKFRGEGHPAKRTFQAVRIEVNGELRGLKECIYDMIRSLNPGGRIAIITFHSLEDRVVKQCFKDLETDCVCDKRLPVCVCGKKKEIEVLTKKPITASARELQNNPRAKSAKLRIAEKLQITRKIKI